MIDRPDDTIFGFSRMSAASGHTTARAAAATMAPTRCLKTHSLLDKRELTAFLEERLPGQPDKAARHCRAILAAAIRDAESGHDACDLSESRVPNLPKWAREVTSGGRFALLTTTVAECSTSQDGSTTKFVIELQVGGTLPETFTKGVFSLETSKVQSSPNMMSISQTPPPFQATNPFVFVD